MALIPVLAVLRRVSSSEDEWPESTLQRVAAELVAAGLQTLRELRLGFPPEEGRRREEIRGLAGEVAAKLSLDAAVLGILLDAAVCSTMGLSTSSCFGPVARGKLRCAKRLLAGVLVDAEAAVAPSTSSTSLSSSASL